MQEAKRKKTASDFGQIFTPTEAQEPILSDGVRKALSDWLEEIWAKDVLAEVGLKARQKAIFDGPPGVGKTTMAHFLAARLGLRMLAVRPDRLLSKWVNQSAEQIGQLFDTVAAEAEPIVLFFDEFDAIALQRKGSEQAATDERNAWVNTLLQRLEQHDGMVIAATNFSNQIDQAIWRRFELHITLEMPGQGERELIVERYLKPYILPDTPLTKLAEALATASPALIRQVCENIKRQLVIGPRIGWDLSKEAVIDRLLSAIQPHPKLGKPRLWSHGTDDIAIRNLPWPLRRALADYPNDDAGDDTPATNVTHLRRP
ncbi:ATP-binding protein [Asticcacaulis sp. ZE23SCel15]|uniref:AAA family ATPase n=1 Tax=Asticcacaulis sp. ZE23SCel15 TaxID=3059027 RepID=UPI00265E195B|nr:ATP-binding protein [Asticcacaulis sp. ZE23SCel15]WKL57273.1 ATP-binding protein [Asticcacaulis sp. ZE23SCel15]